MSRNLHLDVPQASQTQHVSTDVIVSPKPALLSANSTSTKGTTWSWPEIGESSSTSLLHYVNQVLALRSLIWSPLAHHPARFGLGVLLRSLSLLATLSCAPVRQPAPHPSSQRDLWKNPDPTWLWPILKTELEPKSISFSTELHLPRKM